MLEVVTPGEIREIAALAKQAREAQEKLLENLRLADRDSEDRKLVEQDITSSTGVLDPTLDNQPLAALRRRLAALDDEARHELLAVAMIGRGLYAPSEWEKALDDARAQHGADEIDRIADTLGLDEWLAKGLFELGRT